MPRIFNYGDIPNIRFTPDKVLNIFIYRSPSYLIIYRSHILLKMVRFFGPPCIYNCIRPSNCCFFLIGALASIDGPVHVLSSVMFYETVL